MLRHCLFLLGAATAAAQPAEFPGGVASGEVTQSSAVIWTRASSASVLELEVSADPDFRSIVFKARREAEAAADFTLKADAFPLTPDTRYFYRWLSATATSPTGRFRTAPAPDRSAAFKFVFAGDSDGTKQDGFPAYNNFEVLESARKENPDFFIYLGDTIYADSEKLDAGPASTLQSYREAYRLNRSYAALRELMQASSTYAMWDDHEVRNDWDAATVPPELAKSGRQAFFEYMPLRESYLPSAKGCIGAPLFRLFRWGAEALFLFIDTRSCRGQTAIQACRAADGSPDVAPAIPESIRRIVNPGAGPGQACLDALNNPGRSFIGADQMELLKLVLRYFPARFKFVVHSVPISGLYLRPYDRWEGYAAQRTELLTFIQTHRIPNVIFLAADLHASLITAVSLDPIAQPDPIATEVVVGPIAVEPLYEALKRDSRFQPNLLNFALGLLGIECASLTSMAYGLVEVDLAKGASISVRDEKGRPLCTKFIPRQ